MTKQSRIARFGDGKVIKSSSGINSDDISKRSINTPPSSTVKRKYKMPTGGILSELDSNFLACSGIMAKEEKKKRLPSPESISRRSKEKVVVEEQVQVASSLPESPLISKRPAGKIVSDTSIIPCSQNSLLQQSSSSLERTPRRQQCTKSEIPSSSPQYTPFNRVSQFRYTFEPETPTKTKQKINESDQDIIKSSQWWEQDQQQQEEQEEQDSLLLPDVEELLWGGAAPPPQPLKATQEDLDSMLQSLPRPPESSCSLFDSL